MADRSTSPAGFRWLGFILVVLVALAAYSHSLPPLVQGFGLAHSRLLEQTIPPTLVVDNMARESSATLQELFPVQVWGRRGFRVHEILFPALMLAVAMGLLSNLLAVHVTRLGGGANRWLAALARPSATMLLGLLGGATLGSTLGGDWRFPTEMALMPFVLASFAVAVASLRANPEAARLSRAFELLSAARWCWLGFLVSAWPQVDWFAGAFDGQAGTDATPGVTPWTLAYIAGAFVLLHSATRAPIRLSLSQVSGDRAGLVRTCDRLSALLVQELWVVLPLLAFALKADPSRHALERLCPYLLTSFVCAILMKWTLQGYPPVTHGLLGRLAGSLFRVATLVLMVAIPVTLGLHSWLDTNGMPVAAPLILVAMGLVRGRPWFSRRYRGDFASPLDPAEELPSMTSGQPRRMTCKTWLAAVAAVAALVVALGQGAREDWSRAQATATDDVQEVRTALRHAFGSRVRLVYEAPRALLLDCSLNEYESGLAVSIVRTHLPDAQLRSVSVSLWRWELAGVAFLGLTVAVSLAAIVSQLLGMGGITSPAFRALIATMAGIDGAFAVGAAWGWFWLNPVPHAAAFGLCTVLSWQGLRLAGFLAQVREMKTAIVLDPAPLSPLAPCPAPVKPGTSVPAAEPVPPAPAAEAAPAKKTPICDLMKVDVLSVEIGRALLPLVDPREGARLLDRVTSIRRHVGMELGVVIPGIRFRDNLQLPPDTYVLKVRSLEVARGSVHSHRFLAIGPEDKLRRVVGVPTTDPTYGMPGRWIPQDQRPIAEKAGCMIFDPVSVVATHLTEVCRTHLPEIITLEFVNGIMDQAWKDMPVTVEAVSKVNSLLTIRDVYRRLLTERVSVRDVETILNVLVSKQATVDELVADCRVALRRAICAEYANQERVIRHLALDPATEGELLKNLRGSSWSDHARARYVDLLAPEIKAVAEKGLYVIFVVSPRLRQPLRQLLAPSHPNIVVLSTDEIEAGYRTESVRTFTLPALSENR